jgi:hypothetical protein
VTALQPVVNVCTYDTNHVNIASSDQRATCGSLALAVDCDVLVWANLQEKVKRMTPEQRAKFEARQERVQTKRAMKQRMIRA